MAKTPDTSKKQLLASHAKDMIKLIGEDPHRQGLKQTPERFAKALQYLTQGYHQNLTEIINDALFDTTIDDMVIVKDIEFYSLCEHHMLPFIGTCHVGYIPNGKVLGLSKIARIVNHFAQRLQIQEQLTEQISHCLHETTDAKGVGVVMEAQHMCMMMRGVQKQKAQMSSSSMRGLFRQDVSTRAEFLSLIDR